MPVSPDQASKANLDSVQNQLDKLYTNIDKQLKAKYFGDDVVTIYVSGPLNSRVRRELIKQYSSVGWNILHSTANDGRNSVDDVFKFSKKEPSTHQRFSK